MTPARRQHLGRRICSDLDQMPSTKAKTFDYFVVMMNHGKRGLEAVVDPEITRREVVSRILTLEYDPERIAFIHHVTSAGVEDVTFGMIAECARVALEGAGPIDDGSYTGDPRLGVRMSPADRLATLHDRAQDERKNWSAQ